MSRLLVTNKSFELLEPYEGKLSRTVLRGESSRKGADLLDISHSFYYPRTYELCPALKPTVSRCGTVDSAV